MRERIGVGTSDMTVGTDLDPPNAATESRSTDVDAGARRTVTVQRDLSHGRSRVRSYVGGAAAMPRGIDPQI